MSELLIGILDAFCFISSVNFYPEDDRYYHKPIQQELIKVNEKDYSHVEHELEEEECKNFYQRKNMGMKEDYRALDRRAESHCNQMHGYALAFEFVFKAKELDEKDWAVDFGSLDTIERWLRTTFDHTTVVAEDDPHRNLFEAMDDADILDLRILPGVGCEMFAQLAFDFASDYIDAVYGDRCNGKRQSIRAWSELCNMQEAKLMDGFISSTDVRLVKEAVGQLIIKQSPLTLKCLHDHANLR